MENECNMALEAPGHFPLDLLLKSLLKINVKWPWRPLSSFLQMSVLNPCGKSMQDGLGGPWAVSGRFPYHISIENRHKKALEASVQYPLDFLIEYIWKINATWPWRHLGSFL